MSSLLFRHITMNQEKLAKLQAQVRIGGKVRKPSETDNLLLVWRTNLVFKTTLSLRGRGKIDFEHWKVELFSGVNSSAWAVHNYWASGFQCVSFLFNSVTCCDLWKLKLSLPVGCSSSFFLFSPLRSSSLCVSSRAYLTLELFLWASR